MSVTLIFLGRLANARKDIYSQLEATDRSHATNNVDASIFSISSLLLWLFRSSWLFYQFLASSPSFSPMASRNFSRALSSASSRGRVALVTGAAQGIGRGIALRLAKDGFDVAVNDLPSNSDALEELAQGISDSSGGRSMTVLGDVSSESDVVGMVKTCASRLGSLDVVCSLRALCNYDPSYNYPHHFQMIANAGIAVVKPFLESESSPTPHRSDRRAWPDVMISFIGRI